MDCRDVREKLSEYIDGMLNEKEASEVKKHLDSCADCTEEYQEMAKIIGHMNSMDRLEPPEFFLHKVKKRLDKPFSLKKIIKRLFFPLSIKLPLELGGIAAAVLLVIYISGTLAIPPAYELTVYRKAPALSDLEEKKGGEPGKSEEAKPPERNAQRAAQKVLGLAAKAEKPEEKKAQEREQEKELTQQKEKKKEKTLQEIVLSVGGKVLKSEYQEDKKISLTMLIEIPAEKYPLLLERLKLQGEIQKPLPSIKEREQDKIQIRMTVQYF